MGRPPPRARGAAPLLLGTILALLLSGCVGWSRTAGDYEEKAANTAEAARSAVETARLVAGAAAAGDAPGPYLSQTLSDMEGSLSSLSTQFASVQPPGQDSDTLRERLLPLLNDCESAVARLRIAARRGETESLPDLAAPLPDLAARLRHIEGLTAT